MSDSDKIVEKLSKIINDNNKNNDSKFNAFDKKLDNTKKEIEELKKVWLQKMKILKILMK